MLLVDWSRFALMLFQSKSMPFSSLFFFHIVIWGVITLLRLKLRTIIKLSCKLQTDKSKGFINLNAKHVVLLNLWITFIVWYSPKLGEAEIDKFWLMGTNLVPFYLTILLFFSFLHILPSLFLLKCFYIVFYIYNIFAMLCNGGSVNINFFNCRSHDKN